MTRPSPRHRAGGAGDGLQKGCASRPPFEETSGVTQGSGKAPEARGNGVASSATKGSARCRGEGVTRQRASRGAHPVRGRVDQIGKGKARTRSETQYLEKPEIMVPGGGIEPPTRGFSIHAARAGRCRARGRSCKSTTSPRLRPMIGSHGSDLRGLRLKNPCSDEKRLARITRTRRRCSRRQGARPLRRVRCSSQPHGHRGRPRCRS